MSTDKFKVRKGDVKGDTQIVFYGCNVPTVQDMLDAIGEVFPGISLGSLNILSGYACTIITEGNDFDVPKS